MAVQRELGGPSLPQERRLVTSVPGPRSLQLQARRDATVARGVGATLPVFVDRAGGRVIVDVDGNSFIDFGAGIAVVSVGTAAPHVVAGVQEQVARYTCFMLSPYEPYVAVCEELAVCRHRPCGDHG
jgi:4-aminobutyrate aminotransferase / (S)-3-amino-2-methylpropionate transaminase / 5-aminovalerate transaminase